MEFRNQFIYGDVAPPPGFVTNGTLHHCPSLPVERSGEAYLVGHALDWQHRTKSNADILAELTRDPLNHSHGLSGQWPTFMARPS